MLRIESYTADRKAEWDDFIATSINGTFLFQRGYMDYHRDRFTDHSLMIQDSSGRCVAVLPANKTHDQVISHGGLTYGGLVIDHSMKIPQMVEVFESILSHLKVAGIASLIYRPVPHIYHRTPADADVYMMFMCSAQLTQRKLLTVVDNNNPLQFQERRMRGMKKAMRNGLIIRQSDDLAAYWNLLENVLHSKHGTSPVHSLDEITCLAQQFPNNIKLYGCFQGELMLAGILIYESEHVARAQYIASGPEGREQSALDLLFGTLLNDIYRHKRYFDFGTSNNPDDQTLNIGLIDQKEGYGARAVILDQYTLDVQSYTPGTLRKVLG